MRRVLQIALTTAAAGAAITALVAAAVPIWLLLRVPAAIVPPGGAHGHATETANRLYVHAKIG